MGKSKSLRPGEGIDFKVGFTMQNLEFICREDCILLVEITASETFRGEYVWAHARNEQGIPAGNRYPVFILNRALPPTEKARAGLQLWDRYLAEKHSHENHARQMASLEAAMLMAHQADGKAATK